MTGIDMSRYQAMFLSEAREHLRKMNAVLPGLEEDPTDREAIDALFREVHSVKGMAASMGYTQSADLAHRLEDLMDGARQTELLTPEAVGQLQSGFDLLEALIDDIEGGRPERLVAPFLAEAAAVNPPPKEPPPPAAERMAAATASTVPPAQAPFESRRDDLVRSVRINTSLLDQFIDLTGEMITNRYLLQSAARAEDWGRLREGLEQQARLVGDLHHHVLQVRMLTMESLTGRLPRLVRELARKTGKEIVLHLAGQEVELDRAILEALAEPLIHLVRNAVDHGIEQRGEISLRAWREQDQVLVEIADNGRGIDPAVIRRQAVAKGMLSAAQAKGLKDPQALQLICLPGFSTAEQITDTSGRGVGMDVVKSAVETLGGSLAIASTPGEGTRFTLKVPVSIAIIHLLLVDCAGHRLGIPFTRVLRAVELGRRDIRTAGGKPVAVVAGEEVPLLSLRKILGLTGLRPGNSFPLILTEARGRRVGLVVDRLAGQRQAFVKGLSFPLNRLPGVSGATVLGDGSVVFVLDPPSLLAGDPGRPAGTPRGRR
ncbi:MAG: chemotaxis protein CheA [Desulfuromonadales bacterium]|nr:chemotaxis protein CheA [Desulfuromonadales bacterium]